MTTYTRPLVNGTPTTGQVVKAGHVNEPIDQIYDTILAGGITSDQIAVGAVNTSELATAAVTAAKMDGTIPDGTTTATNAAPTAEKEVTNRKFVIDQNNAQTAGLIKAWVSFDGDDGSINGSFNVTGVVRDNPGNYTITWDTNFADANYVVVGTTGDTARGFLGFKDDAPTAAGTCVIATYNSSGVDTDYNNVHVMAIGTQ